MTDALRQQQELGTHIAEELNRTACLLLQAVNDEADQHREEINMLRRMRDGELPPLIF